MAARILAAALALLVGAAAGFVLTFTHRQYVAPLLGVDVPWGLIGGLAIVAALLAGMRLAFADRVIPIAGGVGVLVATAVLAIPNAGGSVLMTDDALGYAWALGPAVITLVVAAWPAPRPRTRHPATVS